MVRHVGLWVWSEREREREREKEREKEREREREREREYDLQKRLVYLIFHMKALIPSQVYHIIHITGNERLPGR